MTSKLVFTASGKAERYAQSQLSTLKLVLSERAARSGTTSTLTQKSRKKNEARPTKSKKA